MSEDFYDHMLKEKELLKMGMNESIRQRDERKMKEPYTIIHTKTFYCDGDHPIVYYTFDNKVDSTDITDKGYVVCEYCYRKFKYEEKKDDKDFVNDVLRGSG
jgi:uncharacterized Zn-finger protein